MWEVFTGKCIVLVFQIIFVLEGDGACLRSHKLFSQANGNREASSASHTLNVGLAGGTGGPGAWC